MVSWLNKSTHLHLPVKLIVSVNDLVAGVEPVIILIQAGLKGGDVLQEEVDWKGPPKWLHKRRYVSQGDANAKRPRR